MRHFVAGHHLRSGMTFGQSTTADIAFLLLIFFIASTVIGAEWGVPLVLPPIGGTIREVPPANVMVLHVTREGRYLCNDQPAGLGEIRSLLTDQLRDNERLIVQISTEADASYQMMMDVLDEAKAAGAGRISLKKSVPRREG